MQIRNAPHYGHEAVFNFILDRFDLLVLNPIFGIKKKNDFSDRFISKALKFMERKYKNIKFLPFFSQIILLITYLLDSFIQIFVKTKLREIFPIGYFFIAKK